MMINLLSIKYNNTYETISIIQDKVAKKYIYSDKKLARKQITLFKKGQYRNQWKIYEEICKNVLRGRLPDRLTLGTYTNEYQLLSKRMGDQGQALGCLSQNTKFIPITNSGQSNVPPISSTNGYFCFVSYDRVAICHALNYNVPLVLHLKPTTNRDLIPILYVRKDITSMDIQQLNIKTQIRAIFDPYNRLYGRVITTYNRNSSNTYLSIQEQINSILTHLEQSLNESINDLIRLNLLYQAIFIIYIILQSPCEILHNYESITPKDPTEFDIQTLDSITDLDSLKQKLNLLKGQMELLRNKEQIQKMLDDISNNNIMNHNINDIDNLGKYIDEDIYSNIESYKPFTLLDRRVSNRGILGALEKDFGILLITKYVNNDFTEKIQQISFKHIYNIILSKLSSYYGTTHAYITMAIEKINECHPTLSDTRVGGTRLGNPHIAFRRDSPWIIRALGGEYLTLENSNNAINHITILISDLDQYISLFIESELETQHHLHNMTKIWIIIEDYTKSFYSVILDILFTTHKNRNDIMSEQSNTNSSKYPTYINIIYTTFMINNSNILQNMVEILSNPGDQVDPDENEQVTLRDLRNQARKLHENDEIELAETDYNLLSTQFNILDTDISSTSLATIFLDLLNNDTYDDTYTDPENSNRGGGKRKSIYSEDNTSKKPRTPISKDDSLSDINNIPINDFLILFRFYQYSYKYFNKIIEIDLKSKISLATKHKLIRTELSNLTQMSYDQIKYDNKFDKIIDDYNKPTPIISTSVLRPMVHGGKKKLNGLEKNGKKEIKEPKKGENLIKFNNYFNSFLFNTFYSRYRKLFTLFSSFIIYYIFSFRGTITIIHILFN